MEKIKQILESEKGKDILIVVIVILVGLASFELGRLSKENDSSGVKIDYSGQNSIQNDNISQPDNGTQTNLDIGNTNLASVISTQTNTKNFFASSKGKKYYTLGCAAGKTIKMENRVYFATGEEAVAAGYTLSNSCN